MGLSNGVLSSPISIGDLQKALGSTSLDTGTLCTSNAINKWAIYRPFRYASWGLSKAEVAEYSASVNYGFSDSTLPYSTTTTALITDGNYSAQWAINKPTGGSSSPYRILDFDGYVTYNRMMSDIGTSGSGSICPCAGIHFSCPNDKKQMGAGSVFTLTWDTSGGGTEINGNLIYLNMLKLATAGTLSIMNWKFGILLIATDSPTASTTYLYTFKENSSTVSPSDCGEFRVLESAALGTLATTLNGKNYSAYPVLIGGVADSYIGLWMNLGENWPMSGTTLLPVLTIDGRGLTGIAIGTKYANFNIIYNEVTCDGTNTVVSATITNETGAAKTVDTLFAYLAAGDLTEDYSAYQAVGDSRDEYVTDGTIYTSGVTYDSKLAGRYVDMLSAFYAANGNSYVVAANASSLTFTVTLSGITKDGFGNDYNRDATVFGGIKLHDGNRTSWGQ